MKVKSTNKEFAVYSKNTFDRWDARASAGGNASRAEKSH